MKTAVLFSALGSAAWAAPARLHQERHSKGPGYSALYFLENNPSGNHIVSMKVGSDGTLSDAALTPTGGIGMLGVNATGYPEPADTMFSGAPIDLVGNTLFAVNAGSRTLSALNINPSSPNVLSQSHAPIDTLGDFPQSVTYSAETGLACVSNGGVANGVACFNYSPSAGFSQHTPLMSAGIITQTTPPHGIPGTVSKVSWSPDNEFLVWTIKGDSTTNSTGKFVYFSYNKYTRQFGKPVVTSFPEVLEPFGFSFISDRELFVADGASGGALVSFNSQGQATLITRLIVPTQHLSCWTVWDPSLGSLYLMDGGLNMVYEFDTSGNYIGEFSNGSPRGSFDSFLMNGNIYILDGTTGISVVDSASKNLVQFYSVADTIPNRQYYVGMVGWSSY